MFFGLQRQARLRRDHLVAGLVALAASVPGFMNDFVYDDLAIIRDNIRVHDFARLSDLFTRPYWPPPYVEQLYRPVALLLFAIQYMLGGGSPLLFRLVSFALYVGCTLGVLRLASRVLPRTAAMAVAVLFAAHPVHVEAVALGVNQGELIVGLVALAMSSRYLDARRAGAPRAGDWFSLAGLYAVAALTKENGFILPGLLLCIELTLIPGRALRSRVRETLGGYALLAGVGLLLIMLRTFVLQTHAVAVVPVIDLRGMTLGERAFAMLQVVPTWFSLLAFPALLKVDYHLVVLRWQAVALATIGLAMIASAVFLALAARRAAPAVAFGIAWCGVALVPVSNLIPTGVLIGERTLFLPSVGFLLAAGGAAVAVLARSDSPVLRRRLITLCVILTTLGVMKSAVRQLSWNSAHVRIAGPRRVGS